jgi:hypothetical protein
MMHDTRNTQPKGVQIKEIIVWIKTASKSIVWKIHKIYDRLWLPSK